MSFLAQSNKISINNGVSTIFSTDYRMPHILASVSGTYTTVDAPISISGGQYTMASSIDTYVAASSMYTFANSFVWAYIKPTANAHRTEINVGNPIFLCGTICLNINIDNNGYRGAILLTPRVYDGYLGFNQENTHNCAHTVDPGYLYIKPGGTAVNPNVTFSYTLYYGRFT